MNNKKVVIIAEAGVNHNGSIDLAYQLVDAAVEAGVDYIKFQTFKAEKLVTQDAPQAEYQTANTGLADTQLAMLKKLELSEEQHSLLIDYCKQKSIQFFSTGFDIESLEYLKSIGLSLVKVPSGELTNLPYLRTAALLFSEVILSTGMATMQEIKDAIAVFLDQGIAPEKITVLHCTTEYPAPFQDVNLRAMQTIANELHVAIGYSDHTEGIAIPVAATALGAQIIEKHFTLDKTLPGPDHKASLEPHELKQMVQSIRQVEQALLGNGIKEPAPSEIKNIAIARKSIVAKKEIQQGEVFSEDNLTTKRPGTGISPMRWEDVIGQKANRDFRENELIVI